MKIEVRRSLIHGLGVFAAKTIRKGERIGRYASRRTTRNGTYVLWLHDDETNTVTGYEGFGRLRFLNHSSQPNSEFDGLDLYALQTIRRGQEITFHYGEDWADVA
jgi:uncharacterized protein